MDEALQGVIGYGSVRDEGTTLHYIPIEYPALADRHIVAGAGGRKPKRTDTFI
jgi:uridine phosphorylase